MQHLKIVKILFILSLVAMSSCRRLSPALSQLQNNPACADIAFSTEGQIPIGEGEMGTVYRKDSQVYKIPKQGANAQVAFQEELELFVNFVKDAKYKPVEDFLLPYLMPSKPVLVEHKGQVVVGLQKQYIQGTTLTQAFVDDKYYEIKPYLTRLIDDVKALAKAGYVLTDFHENNIMWDGRQLKIIDGGLTKNEESNFAANAFKQSCWAIKWCRRVLHSETQELPAHTH